MGCHLDAELEGEELDFDDPIGYNGSDQDYQDDAFSRVRDGLDLDESSRMSNPNKKEVADIYERNQN